MAKTEKRCTKCGQVKPLTEFALHHQGVNGPVLRPQCRACGSKQSRQWELDNPEHHYETKRRRELRTLYGITPEEYEDLLARQDGGCGICGTKDAGAGHTRLPVDHDHVTGRVRGILCHACNRAIGLLGDDIDRLKKAVKYLEGAE